MISKDLQSYTVTTIANNSRLSSVHRGIRFGLANSIIKAHTGLAKTEYKIQNDNKIICNTDSSVGYWKHRVKGN